MPRAASKSFEQKIAKESKENPKKAYSYINSEVTTRQGVGDISTDPDNPKSKVTDNDQEKETSSLSFLVVFKLSY